MSNLIQVDFSKGIRNTEINENFDILLKEIEDERISLTGPGITTGLELSLTNNVLSLSKGAIINQHGQKIEFNETSFNIDYPILEEITQRIYIAESFAKLNYIPYNPNRKHIARVSYINKNVISCKSLLDAEIEINKIEDKNVFLKNNYTGQSIFITYYHTDIRYDTVYIDTTTNKIKVAKGITSFAANKYIPENAYVLGYILINPYGTNDTHASFSLINTKKDFRKVRTYNNDLYLSGNKFSDLGLIHLTKPDIDILQDKMIWADYENNLLKQYRKNLDKWFNINDTAYANRTESWLWGTMSGPGIEEQFPADGQTFLFDTDEKRKLRFIPNTNSVTVILDNIVLHKDQYEELLDPEQEDFQNLVNRGYGIKFAQNLLDGDPHTVEIRVKHNVNANEVTNRWFRSASIVEKKDIEYDSTEHLNQMFTVEGKHYYLYHKGQIQVSVNGQILRDSQIEEGSSLTNPQAGDKCKTFRVLIPLNENDWVSYRIDKAIFTYDGFDEFLDEYSENIRVLETRLNDFIDGWTPIYTALQAKDTEIEGNVSTITTDLNTANENIENLEDGKRDKDVKIEESDLAVDVKSRIQSGFINASTTMPNDGIITLDVNTNDYVQIFYKGDKPLARDIDYTVTNGSITITSGDVVNGDAILITGLKFR